MYLTLLPAYGRDYKNKKLIIDDLNSNKDFIESSSNSLEIIDRLPCVWNSTTGSPVKLFLSSKKTTTAWSKTLSLWS